VNDTERSAMSPAERQRRFRERIAAGRKVYQIELIDVQAEALVESCGGDIYDMRAGITAILEDLIDIDDLVTRNGETMQKVFLSLKERYRVTDGEP
jgi:hypothetical protein